MQRLRGLQSGGPSAHLHASACFPVSLECNHSNHQAMLLPPTAPPIFPAPDHPRLPAQGQDMLAIRDVLMCIRADVTAVINPSSTQLSALRSPLASMIF